jgi:magnesium-transporting ATPase (P-type)
MYDEETQESATASNTAIAEDLGHVQYFFTDKTGTLTENKMVLKQCSIDGDVFGSLQYDSILHDARLTACIQKPNESKLYDFFRNIAVGFSVIKLIVTLDLSNCRSGIE